MAVALRGAIQTATSTSTPTSLAVNTPTGFAQGDVFVVVCSTNNETSTATNASMTGLTATIGSNLSSTMIILYGTAGASPPASYTITLGTPHGVSVSLALAAFSGANGGTGASFWDPSNPAHSAAVEQFGTNTVSLLGLENSASEATLVNGDMILYLLGGIFTNINVPPTGFSGAVARTTIDANAGIWWKTQATAGTVGTISGTYTGTPSTSDVLGQVLAIRAAAPAGYIPGPRSNVAVQRVANWLIDKQPWKDRKSGLVVPGFADKRLVVAG